MVATFAVALTLVAVNALAGQATVDVAGSLNANWRGAYDILVTSPTQDFGGSKTQGLVDSNFVSDAGDSGISLTQLKKIRKIADVGVAAPIGMVGTLRDLALTPSLYVPDNPATNISVLSDKPDLLRVTTTLGRESNDVSQTLSRTTGLVALQARKGSAAALIAAGAETSVSYPSGFAPQTDDFSFQIPLGQLPAFPTSVIAVDPVAEVKLWKGRADYLAPLEDASTSRAATSSASDWASQVDKDEFLVQQSNLSTADSDPAAEGQSVVPLVVNRTERADLSVEVTIEKAPLAGPLPAEETALQSAAATAKWQSVGTVSTDASEISRPFSSPSLSLQWPGTKKPASESGGVFYSQATSLEPTLVGRPDYTSAASLDGKTPAFQLNPKGITGPDGAVLGGEFSATSGADTGVGQTRAFRSEKTPGGSGFSTVLPAPIGTFTTMQASDTGTQAASYVPSGIGGGQQPTMLKPAVGTGTSPGQIVDSSLSNLSFQNEAPGAFTDLQGGASLRGSTPVDAIRIQVSGVHGYTQQSRERIANVAQQIAELGLTSTVVAGSSLQPVSVYVPKYFVDNPKASDLGWIDEEWTTLGASVTVGKALTGSTTMLSIAAALAVALALILTQLVTARGRRIEVVLLRTVGWTRPAIRRRILLTYLPGAAVILLTASVSLALTATSLGLLAWGVSSGLVAAAVVASVLGAHKAMGAPRQPRQDRRRRHPSTSRDLALRHLVASPGSTVAQALGVLLFIIAAATGTQALLHSRAAAGTTRLAGVVFNAGLAPLVLLISTAAVGSLLLCVLGRRSEEVRRRAEQTVLRAAGFTARQRARIRQWEVLAISLVAGAGGTLVVGVASLVLHAEVVVTLVAAAAAIVAIVVLNSAARKES